MQVPSSLRRREEVPVWASMCPRSFLTQWRAMAQSERWCALLERLKARRWPALEMANSGERKKMIRYISLAQPPAKCSPLPLTTSPSRYRLDMSGESLRCGGLP